MRGLFRWSPIVALAFLAWPVSPAPAAVGISLGASVALGGLAPGEIANTPNIALNVSLSFPSLGWSLRVAPTDASSPTPGRMRAAATPQCATSAPALQSPLQILTTATIPTTTVHQPEYDLVAGSTQIASGVVTDALVVVYKQPVGTMEQLNGNCTYSVGVTWTIIGS